jgi:hypothetical protein
MCGLKRADYDDLGLDVGSPHFEDHCSKQHDPWVYVAYVAHLRPRRLLDCTGAEANVKGALANSHMSWIPTKTSFALEAHGRAQEISHGPAEEKTGLHVTAQKDA